MIKKLWRLGFSSPVSYSSGRIFSIYSSATSSGLTFSFFSDETSSFLFDEEISLIECVTTDL
jgi:hypothetical protein